MLALPQPSRRTLDDRIPNGPRSPDRNLSVEKELTKLKADIEDMAAGQEKYMEDMVAEEDEESREDQGMENMEEALGKMGVWVYGS